MLYQCDCRSKTFTNPRQLRAHQLDHIDQLFECDKCDRTFVSEWHRDLHGCCHFVDTWGMNREQLTREYEEVRRGAPCHPIAPPLPPEDPPPQPPPPPPLPKRYGFQRGGAMPRVEHEFFYLDQLEEVFEEAIANYHRPRLIDDIINIKVTEAGLAEVGAVIIEEYKQNINTVAKVSASPGFALRNRETGELRCFHSSLNNLALVDHLVVIENTTEFTDSVTSIFDQDLLEHLRQRRPNSKWIAHKVTNTTFYFFNYLNLIRIGAPIRLPSYIKTN